MREVLIYGAGVVSGVVGVFLWILAEERRRQREPNQWSRYKGIMKLRAKHAESPPLDSARTIQVVYRTGPYKMQQQ